MTARRVVPGVWRNSARTARPINAFVQRLGATLN
jgi:hypothetical protein